jgi:hypothetical protein
MTDDLAAAVEAAEALPEVVPDAAGLPDDVEDGTAGEDDPAVIDQPPTTDQ